MKESEIRPADLHNRYLELVESDARRILPRLGALADVPCPACGSRESEESFRKFGQPYRECRSCGTLFLSPRPDMSQMARFHAEAESTRFWSERFYKETEEKRREKMFRPRAELVGELQVRFGSGREPVFADIGAGYGIFLEEVRHLGRFARIVAVEPEPRLAAVCEGKGFPVVRTTAEEAPEGACAADLASAFEVLEHVFSPLEFLGGVRRLLRPGGVLVLTTLSSTGFDIQMLWDGSKAVCPPHHANFLSLAGMRTLFRRAGFEVLELETPGKLDVDIVANTLKERPGLAVPRFARALASADEETRRDLQLFLERRRLSSHTRAVVRKTSV